MASLNSDGTPITKGNNVNSFRHLGHIIEERSSLDDSLTGTASASGERPLTNLNTIGVTHHPVGAYAYQSGMSSTMRNADNTVEIEKYTVDGSTSGNLGWQYTKKFSGIHTSVSEIESPINSVASGVSERKIFFTDADRLRTSGFDDWTIFDASGVAVGEADGTTDIDVTPAATFAGASGETYV